MKEPQARNRRYQDVVNVKINSFKLILIFIIVLEILAIASIANQRYLQLTQQESLKGEPTNPTDFTQPVEGETPYLLEPGISEFTDGYAYRIPGYRVRTNSHGLRGEEFKEEPESGVKRILVVGDSNTFGWGVNRSERFTNLLEERLNQENSARYQVINAGIPGWGMKDFHFFLKERGINYNPDIVVVAFNFNDVVSVERENEFRREAERTVPENASDREQKIFRKRIELKNSYFEQASIRDSNISRYMREISDLTENRGSRTYFYYLESIRGTREKAYRDVLENYSAEFVPGPMEFGTRPTEDYTLPGKDSHYNQKSHRWLAKKLYRKLGSEI
jgi:lysophospholipase L1-like esterase